MIARAVALAFAAVVLGVGGASAAPPTLTPMAAPAGCLSSIGHGFAGSPYTGYCTYNPLLKGVYAAAMSPDGKNLYVVSRYGNTLVGFARNPTTGALTQLPQPGGCFTKHGSDGCQVGRALWEPVDVVVSPDGLNVYVASWRSGGVAVFLRDKVSGTLTQPDRTKGCITATGSGGGCAKGRALAGARALAVAGLPGLKSYVFVASETANGVAALTRNLYAGGGGDGSLSQASGKYGCIEHRGNEGCADGRALMGPNAITADQSNVYMASGGTGGIAVFKISGDSGLQQLAGTAGCVTADGSGGACAKGRAVEAPDAIAESPDHHTVYVSRGRPSASPPPDGGLAVFTRAADGSLRQAPGADGCLTPDGKEGCEKPSVYLASMKFQALTVTAETTYLGFYAGTRAADGSLLDITQEPWDYMGDVRAIVTSPDRRNVYVVGNGFDPLTFLDPPASDGIQIYRAGG